MRHLRNKKLGPGKHIGRLLETARKIRGMTADKVGELCNVTRGRVYQWEKEKRILPKNLPALSAALGVPLKMLQAENGQRPVSKKWRMSKIEHRRPRVDTSRTPSFARHHA